ncbi:probable LRR receptor-like protein kinase At1g51890 [Gossypium arboreum]|uniref:probable LRR receptor-like protein kinase At1g51890 n=1 Tax=Gossypium arboreum TaxID=29729 RepID=UPI0022F146D5|nr:probable LRR receptor-like protein kinase At1g51890 [Gossypium arboreum]
MFNGSIPAELMERANQVSSSDQKTDVVDSRKTNQLQGSSKNRQFTHAQLKRMTNNFGRVVGKGGFGTLYHGYDETQVAVKMLSPSPVQGYKQFQAEVELLFRVHHRNLATIVGYCDDGSNMGLIYEFMAKGNLAEYLKDSSRGVLNWKGRLGIALEAAHKDSFGVALLEIITNRPVTTKTYNQATHISQWVRLMLSNGDMEAIADSRTQGDFEIASMKKEVEVAMACVSSTSTKRPTMNDVVIELNRCLSAEIDRNYSPNMDDDQRQNSSPSLESKNRRFTFAEVQRMTNNLERILGKRGFGTVFSGYLDDTQAAVKMPSHSSVQGYKQRYI